MKINIANRQQLLGVIAIGAVVLWAANQLIISPLYGSWTTRGKRITELKKKVADGQGMLQRATAIERDWEADRINTLSNNMSIAYGQVLQAVDRWAGASRINVTSKRPQWKKGDDKEYSTLECSVDATGDIGAMASFLYEIERDPLGVKVNTVDITSRDNSGDQLTLALQLSFLQLNETKP
jgi:hypothetical protein